MNILGILYGICALISTVCLIMVVVKMFQRAGVGMGILGILTCGIAALIWGWMKAKELNMVKLMTLWTITLVASMVLGTMLSATIMSSPEVQKAIRDAQEKAQQK